MTEGQIEQQCAGIPQKVTPGNAVWYYENETISGRILEAPWTFYTINFFAPRLPPAPPEQRIVPIDSRTLELAEALLLKWRDTSAPATRRHLAIHVLLLQIIGRLLPEAAAEHRIDQPARLWWDIESQLRSNLAQPVDIRYLTDLCGQSERSITRACHLAVGTSPMKRVKQLRLSYAQGLVLHSQQQMTDIAFAIGYSRVQEFSRDYHKHFGVAPSEDRKTGPRYKELQKEDGE
ncbi:MAG: helix-turn-helix transcriptional regulator [Gammaproteobacteria bacterium]|nr:helix-turn-helix transcriptional regulator [Gammaproteobacteria bacterium]